MDKEKSVLDKFLDGEEGQTMFEKPEDSMFSQKEEVEEKVEEEEKALPFHKDPKVLKFIEKEISKRTQKQEESKPSRGNDESDEISDAIQAFTDLIGNDTPEKANTLNSLKKALVGLDDRAVQRAEQKILEIKEREERADREAEEELEEAFDNIEEAFDVDLSSSRSGNLKKEFVTFVEKIAPKDKNGNVAEYPDMLSAWETFSQIKKSTAQPSRAKEIASRSMARSSETPVNQQPKRIDWNAVDEYMDTFNN